MKRLFDPTKSLFAAWVWLYDIDRYWTERMPTMHPTQPEAVPFYYASVRFRWSRRAPDRCPFIRRQ